MQERTIVYFEREGKENIEQTIHLVSKRATETGIKKVVIFTSDGVGPLKAHELLYRTHTRVIAVTFPYKRQFIVQKEDGSEERVFPGTSDNNVVKQFAEKGIPLVRCPMPFDDIVIPWAPSNKLEAIKWTLQLVSKSFPLCIQAILMATECGEVEPGEEVIAASSDTAIIATGCPSRLLFHPKLGMKIKEFICRPLP